jgi:hypothetical protein
MTTLTIMGIFMQVLIWHEIVCLRRDVRKAGRGY